MSTMMNIRHGIYSVKKSGVVLPARFKAIAVGDGTIWKRCLDNPADPASWGDVVAPFGGAIGCAYSGVLRRFLASGYAANSMAYSDDDGATWTTTPVTFATYQMYYVRAHNLFYAATSAGGMFTSPNGIAWTAVGSPGFAVNGIAFSPTLGTGDGRLVVVGGASGKYSDDKGVTWTAMTTNCGNAVGVRWSAKLGLFELGGRAANGISWSTDGITWVAGAPSQVCNWVAINERTGFCHASPHASGNPGVRSTDGKVWTAGNMHTGLGLTCCWIRDRRVFLSGYFGGGMWCAPDHNAGTWTESFNRIDNWYGLAFTDQTDNPD